jgi:hypothetical protein
VLDRESARRGLITVGGFRKVGTKNLDQALVHLKRAWAVRSSFKFPDPREDSSFNAGWMTRPFGMRWGRCGDIELLRNMRYSYCEEFP